MSEAVPGFSSSTCYGLVGPAGLSKAVVARMTQTMTRVLERPDVQERLRADVVELTPTTMTQEFAASSNPRSRCGPGSSRPAR